MYVTEKTIRKHDLNNEQSEDRLMNLLAIVLQKHDLIGMNILAEADLIHKKKSHLSKSRRDGVVLAVGIIARIKAIREMNPDNVEGGVYDEKK